MTIPEALRLRRAAEKAMTAIMRDLERETGMTVTNILKTDREEFQCDERIMIDLSCGQWSASYGESTGEEPWWVKIAEQQQEGQEMKHECWECGNPTDAADAWCQSCKDLQWACDGGPPWTQITEKHGTYVAVVNEKMDVDGVKERIGDAITKLAPGKSVDWEGLDVGINYEHGTATVRCEGWLQ